VHCITFRRVYHRLSAALFVACQSFVIASIVSRTIDQLDILHTLRRPRYVKSDFIYFLNIFFQDGTKIEGPLTYIGQLIIVRTWTL